MGTPWSLTGCELDFPWKITIYLGRVPHDELETPHSCGIPFGIPMDIHPQQPQQQNQPSSNTDPHRQIQGHSAHKNANSRGISCIFFAKFSQNFSPAQQIESGRKSEMTTEFSLKGHSLSIGHPFDDGNSPRSCAFQTPGLGSGSTPWSQNGARKSDIHG